MNIIFYLMIPLIVAACNHDNKTSCELSEVKEFRFFRESFSIDIPDDFTLIDTSNYDFEKNDKYLYNAQLLTDDSLNIVFITVENFQDYNINRNDVSESIKRISTVQMSMMEVEEGGQLVERYDTARGKLFGEFLIEGKRNGDSMSAGGMTLYHNKIRVEILVMMNKNRFNNARNNVECLMSSLRTK